MHYELTPAGWTFMVVSCAVMIIWTGWCYYRVMTAPNPGDEIPGPYETP